MVEVTRTFTVSTPPEQVHDYLRDFSNAAEWDPGTVSCERIGSGPVEIGTQWRNVSKIAGIETALTYELTTLKPGNLVFTGNNDTATTADDIRIAPGDRPGTTEIAYHATIEFLGAAKLAAPIAKGVFEKVGVDTERSLTGIFGAID
ncbi:polyketide cyclase [Amycolatopsis antarctica]|uniref:Polyketide cyclase n=1 Tax=Amycolatopsis antarctica TaxID=1854586 RepID=A0A263D0E1_9PSEU|nr:SRPBCC family protein [Amycolatopsis antarctica]OZM71097.1 polyketide cyclase [Amycolatopsis antarctica]